MQISNIKNTKMPSPTSCCKIKSENEAAVACSKAEPSSNYKPSIFEEFDVIRKNIEKCRDEIRTAREREREAFVHFDLFKIKYGDQVDYLIRDFDNIVEDRRAGWDSMSKVMTDLASKRKEAQALEKARRERKKQEQRVRDKQMEAYRLQEEAKKAKRQAYKIQKMIQKQNHEQKKYQVYQWKLD